ncbi:hypothetical protein D5018_08200 [Parashewanella curva]|uniref:Uncharacterized protein n=1 Tax=Parashewanella curva TaxID=2338552 RepID=A0A3L8PY99_9GAMM|nr:hypothetical protein [Parashewanella curva]RLV60235.1 hypothetical protein D5018_08200 [Parashewanella curva]
MAVSPYSPLSPYITDDDALNDAQRQKIDCNRKELALNLLAYGVVVGSITNPVIGGISMTIPLFFTPFYHYIEDTKGIPEPKNYGETAILFFSNPVREAPKKIASFFSLS